MGTFEGPPHVGLTEARRRLPETVGKAELGGERVVLERQGKPVAALVPLEDPDLLKELEDEYLARLADAAEAEPGDDLSWDQVKAESKASP